MPALPTAFGRTIAIAAAVTAALLVSGCSLQFPPSSGAVDTADHGTSDLGTTDDDTTVPEPEEENTDVFTIAVGDCLNETSSDTVSEVPQVDCAAPHDYEVYYDFTLTGSGEYPGEDEVQTDADTGCESAFAGFVGLGYEDSILDFTYYYPTVSSWTKNGDRLVSCIIVDPGVKTTGSLKGSAR